MNIKQKAFALCLAASMLCTLCSCSFLTNIRKIGDETQSATQQVASTPPATEPPKQAEDFAHSYNSLDDEKTKEIYMNIADNAQLRIAVPFKVEGEATDKQMYVAFQAYQNDHPEVFWLKDEVAYYFQDGYTTVYLSFYMSEKERKSAKQDFNNTVDEIVANAPKNASDYEKELYVNDYLVNNCEYDYEAADSREEKGDEGNAYGALVNKKAVCEGYARAFQLLCNRLGVDCVTVYGKADGENHAWNCAMLDNEWYQADVTWNDSDAEPKIENCYLNLTDEQICIDHTIGALYSNYGDEKFENWNLLFNLYVPSCTATKYNFYRQTCVTITDLDDSGEIVETTAKAAKDNARQLSFVIDDSLDFDDTADCIIYDGYLSLWIDRANLKNWYSPNLNNECLVYKVGLIRVITIELEYI